jgi:hypothetical protein
VSPMTGSARRYADAAWARVSLQNADRRAARGGFLTELGWGWQFVNGSQRAHLCPSQIGTLSRSACNRLPLDGAHLEEQLGALYEPLKRCRACVKEMT